MFLATYLTESRTQEHGPFFVDRGDASQQKTAAIRKPLREVSTGEVRVGCNDQKKGMDLSKIVFGSARSH